MSAPNSVQKLRGPAHDARTTDNVAAVLNPLAEAVGNTPIMGAAPPPWIRPDIDSASTYAQAPSSGATPLPVTAFHKDALGYVHGKVALVTATGSAGGAIPFVMPLGYRPAELASFVMQDGGGNIWEAAVYPNGNFEVLSTLGAGDLITGLFSYLAEA